MSTTTTLTAIPNKAWETCISGQNSWLTRTPFQFAPIEGRTDFSSIDEAKETALAGALRSGLIQVRSAAVAVLIGSAQALADNEPTRPLRGFDQMFAMIRVPNLKSEYPVADFIKPVKLSWNKSARRVRQAAKRFSEETYADY